MVALMRGHGPGQVVKMKSAIQILPAKLLLLNRVFVACGQFKCRDLAEDRERLCLLLAGGEGKQCGG
ncbi:MAG: hypothetical protein WDN31_11035 [Hyphomicrobium sp.]